MPVSRITKLRWFDLGADAFARTFPGALHRLGIESGSIYVCPICDRGFSREAVNAGLLTAEHAPPESFGGRALVLTCRKCNVEAGAHIDAQAHRRERLIEALLGAETHPLKVHIRRGDISVDACFRVKTGGTRSLEIGDNNNPDALAAFKALGPPVPNERIKINFAGERYYSHPADVCFLRAGFLALFAVAGYRASMDPAMRIVKEQIRRPRKQLITQFTITPRERRPWSERRLFQCDDPHCAGAQIGPYIVVYPNPGDMTFYERLRDRAAEKAGAEEIITAPFWCWPDGPTFGA